MFRFMRHPLKAALSIGSISRLPLGVESQVVRGEVHNIQTVRFQKRRVWPGKFAVAVVTTYLGYAVFKAVVWNPMTKEMEELGVPENMPNDMSKDKKTYFIPFPGTTRVLEPREYTFKDPELQAIQKLDRREMDHMKAELISILRTRIPRSPGFAKIYGTDIKAGANWFHYSTSGIAPPIVVRYGIKITDEGIKWDKVPVEQEKLFRINRALQPTAMAISTWSFVKTVVSLSTRRVTRFFGLQIGPPTLQELLLEQQQQMSQIYSPTTKQPQQPLGDTQTQKSGDLAAENSNITNKRPTQVGLGGDSSKPPMSTPYEAFLRGAVAFNKEWKKNWEPTPYFPPGGSISVTGRVQFKCTKRAVTYDVSAIWDPKSRKYDPRSVHYKRCDAVYFR